ncbi:MAG TPA: hypothetical protein VEU07_14450, partial [Candidatus Acidoferrum sp.]|nr:hypothetical protein [Candidatus Acidoferrum sp.]
MDAYKGPLANHGDTLVTQAISIAQATRLQLTQIRGAYLTRQEFKAYIPGSEVWAINRLLEIYDDPSVDAGDAPVAAPTAAVLPVEQGVQRIERLLGRLDRGEIPDSEGPATASAVSDAIAQTLGGAIGPRTRAEIDQMAFAWIRNRQDLLRERTKAKDAGDREGIRKAEERQRQFQHQMVDVLTNAGRLGIYSQRLPVITRPLGRRRGLDHLMDEWQGRLEASRAVSIRSEQDPSDRLKAEELQARERLLDGFTILGEAMRALSLVVGGTAFLQRAQGAPAQPDDPIDLQFMVTMDAFGNALLFAADSARQEAGFSRRMDARPPEADAPPADTEMEWRRARGRSLDMRRADLEDQFLDLLAEGAEDRGNNLDEKNSDARAKARGTE